MVKEHLNVEERIAISLLIELVRDAEVLVDDDTFGSEDNMVTTGKPLDLYSFNKSDWQICLKALEE
jgi:hypothetical protein